MHLYLCALLGTLLYCNCPLRTILTEYAERRRRGGGEEAERRRRGGDEARREGGEKSRSSSLIERIGVLSSNNRMKLVPMLKYMLVGGFRRNFLAAVNKSRVSMNSILRVLLCIVLLDFAIAFPTPRESPSPYDYESEQILVTTDHVATLADRLLVNYKKQENGATKQETLEARLARLLEKRRSPSYELRTVGGDYQLDLWMAS